MGAVTGYIHLISSPEELETQLSSRPTDGGEHAEAERAEAKAGAQEANVLLSQVQHELAEVSASVRPAPPRAKVMTETEEELREAVRALTRKRASVSRG